MSFNNGAGEHHRNGKRRKAASLQDYCRAVVIKSTVMENLEREMEAYHGDVVNSYNCDEGKVAQIYDV